MKLNPLRACAFLLTLATLTGGRVDGADIVIDRDNATETHDCERQEATVQASGSTVTLENCSYVTISGSHNTVHAGSAWTIRILGSYNTVTWVRRDRRPKVLDLGFHNTAREQAGAPRTAPEATTRAKAEAAPKPGMSQPTTVDENGQTRSYKCGEGGEALVTGNGNTLTFRDCRRVSIRGNKNTVDAGLADVLVVLGKDNTVAWLPPPSGLRPRIVDLGDGNTFKEK